MLWVHDSLVWHTHAFAIPNHTGEPLPVKCPASLSRCESARIRLTSVANTSKTQRVRVLWKWWDIKRIKAGLFDLYCIGSYAQLVRIRAYENSLDGQNVGLSADQFWSLSEAQLCVQIPDGWEDELSKWRSLCASTNFVAAKKLQQIESDSDSLVQYPRARRILDRAPADAWIEPTALGNLMAALEEYGQARYAIDTSSLWSRIEQIATKEQRAAVAAAKLGLESAANLTAAFFLVAWMPLVSPSGSTNVLWNRIALPSFLLGGLLFAGISYVGTLSAAESLSERMKAVIDVNLLSLLRVMGLQPTSGKQQREMLDALGGPWQMASHCPPQCLL